MVTNISSNELKKMIDEKEEFILLDVRSVEEHESEHIKGSLNISYDELEKRHEEIGAGKDELIVVYCRSGNRSSIGAETLERLGYKNVLNLSAGLMNWSEEIYMC